MLIHPVTDTGLWIASCVSNSHCLCARVCLLATLTPNGPCQFQLRCHSVQNIAARCRSGVSRRVSSDEILLCRELQLKYGKRAESETPTSQAVEEPNSAGPAPHSLQKTGSWIATKLQEQSPSSICESKQACCFPCSQHSNVMKTLRHCSLPFAFRAHTILTFHFKVKQDWPSHLQTLPVPCGLTFSTIWQVIALVK